jgi:hypothetical protein
VIPLSQYSHAFKLALLFVIVYSSIGVCSLVFNDWSDLIIADSALDVGIATKLLAMRLVALSIGLSALLFGLIREKYLLKIATFLCIWTWIVLVDDLLSDYWRFIDPPRLIGIGLLELRPALMFALSWITAELNYRALAR